MIIKMISAEHSNNNGKNKVIKKVSLLELWAESFLRTAHLKGARKIPRCALTILTELLLN